MQQKCMTMFSSVCSVDLYWLTSVGQPTVVESGIWGSGGYCAVSHGQATRMSLCVCVRARVPQEVAMLHTWQEIQKFPQALLNMSICLHSGCHIMDGFQVLNIIAFLLKSNSFTLPSTGSKPKKFLLLKRKLQSPCFPQSQDPIKCKPSCCPGYRIMPLSTSMNRYTKINLS